MAEPIVVFDLDGTLVDTAADLVASLNHSLETSGLKAAGFDTMREHAGRGGRFMLEHAFAAQQRRMDERQIEAMLQAFLTHYADAIPGRSALFPGAVEALERLSAAGYLLAICTNKPSAMSVRLVEALGHAGRFAAHSGADTFAFRKPDPRHLTETIRLAGGDPARAVMVGDSRTDIDTAKAAGIPVIAVDFGYSDRHVREFEPSRVISDFNELTPALVQSLIDRAQF